MKLGLFFSLTTNCLLWLT